MRTGFGWALREWPLRLAWWGFDVCLRVLPGPVLRAFLTACERRPEILDRLAFHVRRVGFNDPLPDFREMARRNFGDRRACGGIDWRFDSQASLLERLSRRLPEARELAGPDSEVRFDFRNGYYEDLDATVLYLLLREMKPKRFLEVGSGCSTRLAAWGLRRNADRDRADATHVCVDPHVNDRVGELPHPVEFIRRPVEELAPGCFGALEAGDMLFIDSTHTVRIFGDVVHLLLGVLPSLKPGVWVHFHDIFLPYEYPRSWVVEARRAWNEQYLLEAYLSGNSGWRVELAMHALCRDHGPLLSRLGYRPREGGLNAAFWISRSAAA